MRLAALLLAVLPLAPARAQQAVRAAPCGPGATPGADWKPAALPGLHLALRLPPELRQRS